MILKIKSWTNWVNLSRKKEEEKEKEGEEEEKKEGKREEGGDKQGTVLRVLCMSRVQSCNVHWQLSRQVDQQGQSAGKNSSENIWKQHC